MNISFPDPIPESLGGTEEAVLKEVALALYAQGKLGKGQARRLSGANWFTFEEWMKERGLVQELTIEHYLQDISAG